MLVRRGVAAGIAMTVALAASGCSDEAPSSACTEPAEAVAHALGGYCHPKLLPVNADAQSPDYGHVPCTFYAAFPAQSPACACTNDGYGPTQAPDLVVERLRGSCREPCCQDVCFCEFRQLEGAELTACQNGTEDELTPTPVGWCYAAPDQGFGDPELVAECPESRRQMLRILPFRHNVLGIFACQSDLVFLD